MKTCNTSVLIFVACLSLVGCSTAVPVVAKFPEAPKNAQACPQLEKLNDDTKLSDVSSTINNNYTLYHECAVRVDTWNEWYQQQKKIFEKVK